MSYIKVGNKYVKIGTGKYIGVPYVSTLTPAYQTVYNAFTTKPDIAVSNAQNAMVAALDASGFWNRIDVFYVFANNASDNALINWKNPGTYNCTKLANPSFNAYEGYQGDGISAYLNTNWNPSTNGINYDINDAAIGIYLRIDQQEDSKYVFGGYDAETNQTRLTPRQTTDTYGATINNAGLNMAGPNTVGNGLFVLTRTASNACSIYRNNFLIETESDAATFKPNTNMAILSRIGSHGYSTNQVSIFFAMDGANNADVSTLYPIIQTYMTAAGKQV
jgi:hypothetical protein